MGYSEEQAARLRAAGVDPEAVAPAPSDAAFPAAFAPPAAPTAEPAPYVAPAPPFQVINPGMGAPSQAWDEGQRARLLASGVDPDAIQPPTPAAPAPAQPTEQPPPLANTTQPAAPARRHHAPRHRGPSRLQVAQQGQDRALDALGDSEQELGQRHADSALTQEAYIAGALDDAETIRQKAQGDYATIEAGRQVETAALEASHAKIGADREQLQKDYDGVGDHRSAGRKIGDVLAIALGAIGTSMRVAGGNRNAHNDVADLIERRVQRDIDQQFKKLDKRGTAIDARSRQVQLARANLGDDVAAKQYLVGQELSRASQILSEGQMLARAEAMGMEGAAIQGELAMRGEQRDANMWAGRAAAEQKRILEAQKLAARAHKPVNPQRTTKMATTLKRHNETMRTTVPRLQAILQRNPDDLPGAGFFGGRIPSGMAGKEARDFRKGISELGDATLRNESGAVVGPEETANRLRTWGYAVNDDLSIDFAVMNEDQIREAVGSQLESFYERVATIRAGDPEAFDLVQSRVDDVRGNSRARNSTGEGAR